MGDVINVHFKRRKQVNHSDDALNYIKPVVMSKQLHHDEDSLKEADRKDKIAEIQRLLNDEIKENARLRAEISRLKWRLKGEE
ncbi:MAG: hypothetical protein VW683_10070 [Betaproteobacteria bacterium]